MPLTPGIKPLSNSVSIITKGANNDPDRRTSFGHGREPRELGPKEVTVNLVQPGSIDTDMNPAHGPFGDTLRQFMALGHYGAPEDIANEVAFLASPKAQYITGSTLTVDGAANARSMGGAERPPKRAGRPPQARVVIILINPG
jgi:hypothetical protein